MNGRLSMTIRPVLAPPTVVFLLMIALAGCASTDTAVLNGRGWTGDSAVPVAASASGSGELVTAIDSPSVAAASETHAVVPAASVAPATETPEPSPVALEEKWGIRVVSLRMTAGGRMVDFRYRVLDAEKALPVFSRKEKPLLVDAESGKSLGVPSSPKLGPLRTSDRPIVGRNFFILFGNPAGLVKPGSRVDIVIGEFKIEDLAVQ